ncbi:ABC transporter permease [Flavitalea sp. BT771]|uniref:ABC transporter permease n=1 Tax=Flavitalea sp. BT771 TaxID=3063329 RepID=UPI0026E40473|nr:ABC transporter permease [Flavitalea sp. BT771]MDO6430506.1 ABC transporter permease [Flavitalea sp. BT771]MDV6219354.1 ABC transporter permease [Flavitalea sp. BT771]
MFRNYLKIAIRNLVRHRLYTFINIGGLSIGISACLLILLFVIHEHSYDSFHLNASRIYSIYARIKMGGDTVQTPGMSPGTGPSLFKADPSVAATLRMAASTQKKSVFNPSAPEKKFGESHFIFADSNFFRFFSFHLRKGNPNHVLTRPFGVVITEETALKYFGREDPIGKLLRYDSAYTFEVTGVAEKAPSNSSITFDLVASLSSERLMSGRTGSGDDEVVFGNYITYFQLTPDAKPENVEHTLRRLAGQNKINKDAPARYIASPLMSSHLEANFTGGDNSRYLAIFPLVAGLILLLALINYMNLSTARATLRAKEVGVRKANGASRSRIAGQFYVESALYALVAFLLGWVLFSIVQPYFSNIIGVTIDTDFIYQPRVLTAFAGLLLITILVAGAYPSIVLSSFKPVEVLYGKVSRQAGGAGLRRMLTVLQFFVSVVLIVSSIVIGRQLYFFRHTGTGVNRENVVTVPFYNIGSHYADVGREVAQLPGISGVAAARYAMYRGYDMSEVILPGSDKPVFMHTLAVDTAFISVLGVEWKIRPASARLSGDQQIVINEAAADKLQLSSNPVGQRIHMGDNKIYTIAGVVRNFNYNSLHSKIDGLFLFIQQDGVTTENVLRRGVLFARIARGVNLPNTLAAIKKIYERRNISAPFEYEFMDDAFNASYKAEDKLAGVLDIFTGLTVLIACLGLFGLAVFSAGQRSKEISIRKVLGADAQQIVVLLTKDFIRLVMISILLAIPVAWYLLHKWLENFAYKISIGWTVFIMAGGAAILVAMLTVGAEALRAAVASPAKGLRSE